MEKDDKNKERNKNLTMTRGYLLICVQNITNRSINTERSR
jgi:hypothetical protein